MFMWSFGPLNIKASMIITLKDSECVFERRDSRLPRWGTLSFGALFV